LIAALYELEAFLAAVWDSFLLSLDCCEELLEKLEGGGAGADLSTIS
jgi:hypothetical protein